MSKSNQPLQEVIFIAGFGSVDTGATIWEIEDTILGIMYRIKRCYYYFLFTNSALYVIDLVRFRQIAAGDRLRGQYQVSNILMR